MKSANRIQALPPSLNHAPLDVGRHSRTVRRRASAAFATPEPVGVIVIGVPRDIAALAVVELVNVVRIGLIERCRIHSRQ
jgi:hypothetical protein